MKTAWRSTVVFTIVVAALVAVFDLSVAFVYQGTAMEQLALHPLFFVAVVVLCGTGSLGAFTALRHRVPTRAAVAVAALLFSAVSFFAVVWLFGLGGLGASAAWLLVGAAIFAGASALVAEGHVG